MKNKTIKTRYQKVMEVLNGLSVSDANTRHLGELTRFDVVASKKTTRISHSDIIK